MSSIGGARVNALENIVVNTNVLADNEIDLVSYQLALAYDGDNLEYFGKAVAGTADGAAAWQIKKLAYSGSNLVSMDYADGVKTFTKTWNSRATYTY